MLDGEEVDPPRPQRLIWEFGFSHFIGTKGESCCKNRIPDLQFSVCTKSTAVCTVLSWAQWTYICSFCHQTLLYLPKLLPKALI